MEYDRPATVVRWRARFEDSRMQIGIQECARVLLPVTTRLERAGVCVGVVEDELWRVSRDDCARRRQEGARRDLRDSQAQRRGPDGKEDRGPAHACKGAAGTQDGAGAEEDAGEHAVPQADVPAPRRDQDGERDSGAQYDERGYGATKEIAPSQPSGQRTGDMSRERSAEEQGERDDPCGPPRLRSAVSTRRGKESPLERPLPAAHAIRDAIDELLRYMRFSGGDQRELFRTRHRASAHFGVAMLE